MKINNFSKHLKIFLLFYCSGIVVGFLILLIALQINTEDALPLFKEVAPIVITYPLFWLLNFIPYLVYIFIRHLVKDYQKYDFKQFSKIAILKVGLPVLSISIFLLFLQSHRTSEQFNYTWDSSAENKSSRVANFYAIDQKQRGIHIFGLRDNLEDIALLQKNNFEWITLTPFIDQKYHDQPGMGIISIQDSIAIRKKYTAIKKVTDTLGLRIMLKPHIWLFRAAEGKWRSDIEMQTAADWRKWFDNYKNTMLTYARIAEELEFEQLCIGTELEKTVELKAEEWLALIKEIKTVFTGKLTYAANWNEGYEHFPHWKELDYIGIQAYFPLNDGGRVSLSKLERSWKNHARQLEAYSKQHDRPILFTELGYRSVKGTATAPWEWNKAGDYLNAIAEKEQYLCYQSFFNVMWGKEWFHGIHIWEWQARDDSNGKNTNFHIEDKPAFNLIMKRFGAK